MKNVITIYRLKYLLQIILISLLGVCGIVFSVLYVGAFDSGVFFDYSTQITSIAISIITVLTISTISFIKEFSGIIYRVFFLCVITVAIVTFSLYLLKISGFLDRVDNVNDFRNFVASCGNFTVFLFVAIQFLQVVVLPIPSFITVGAGVLLFGPFIGAVLSFIGIVFGSIIAFFLGRIFGIKIAKWLIGEKTLNKMLSVIKSKDKIVFTFMFFFPFFPDDVLCFVAGITTMDSTFFIFMIIVARFVTIFTLSYSINGNIIPYNTWWGVLLWVFIFVFIAILARIIYKKLREKRI